MEAIYMNVEGGKPVAPENSTSLTGARRSEQRQLRAVVLSLSLLSVFLLAGILVLGLHYKDSAQSSVAENFTTNADLTERLQASEKQLSSLTEERELLKDKLAEMTKQMNRIQTGASDNMCCPPGWTKFRGSCYLLSKASGSWDEGRNDCKARGADLVVIDSLEEQMFLSSISNVLALVWIGLTDGVREGTWMWINGAPLTEAYWQNTQPDNGGPHANTEEDCAHIAITFDHLKNWNDLPCGSSQKWICKKKILMFEKY